MKDKATWLKSDLGSEVQLSHGRVGCQAGNLSAAAVYAIVGLAGVDVVEDVERFKPELRTYTFCHLEVLEQRKIRIEEPRTEERISSAAKGSHGRTLEGSADLPGRGHLSHRRVVGYSSGRGIIASERLGQAANNQGAARPGVFIAIAILVLRSPWQAAAPIGCRVQLEAANQQVEEAARISHETLTFPERQFVNATDREHVLAVGIIWAVVDMRIDGKVIAVVIQAVRPRIVRHKLQTIAEPLLDLCLQGIVIGHGIVAKEVDALRPAESGKRPALDLGNGWEAHERRLVDVRSRVVLVESMPVVADICDFCGQRIGDLMLNRQVVGVQSRKAHSKRAGAREDTIRQWQQAVGGHGWKNRRARSIFKEEDRGVVIRCVVVLYLKHGEVLGYRMAEDRPEDPNVVAPPITRTDNGLGTQLIGNTQSRSKVVKVIFDVEIPADTTNSGNAN